jgi:hypothetical protein
MLKADMADGGIVVQLLDRVKARPPRRSLPSQNESSPLAVAGRLSICLSPFEKEGQARTEIDTSLPQGKNRSSIHLGIEMAAARKTRGLLRLSVDGIWTTKQIATFLDTFRDTYAMLLQFLPSAEEIAASKEERVNHPFLKPWPGVDARWDDGRIATLADFAVQGLRRDPATMPKVFSERLSVFDEPVIESISISSPGWVEVIGRLNPLQAIHDIVVLIRDWREQKQRSRLENNILEMEVIRQRIQILRDAGIPNSQVQEYVQIVLTPGTHFLLESVTQRRIVESSFTEIQAEAIPPTNPSNVSAPSP